MAWHLLNQLRKWLPNILLCIHKIYEHQTLTVCTYFFVVSQLSCYLQVSRTRNFIYVYFLPTAIQAGDKLGWGIRYLPPITVDDSPKRPIICCVSMNGRYQTSVCHLEPHGGYFPFIAFTAQGNKLVYTLAL